MAHENRAPVTCGHAPLMHEMYRNGILYHKCCRCHVLLDNMPPADWHAGCMSAYREKKAAELTSDDQTLKPCPFCGGEGLRASVIADNGITQHVIRCRSCACEGGWGKTETSAASYWNMRHDK